MDLNTRVNINFARVDVNFRTVTVTYILIPINFKVLLILHTKFQPNIPCHFGERDLNAWVDINFFRVDANFQMAIVT